MSRRSHASHSPLLTDCGCAPRPITNRAIKAKLDYLVALRDEARQLHAQGRGLLGITHALLGRESLMSLMTSFHFSKRNLIRACLP